jgi:hypothetical protein
LQRVSLNFRGKMGRAVRIYALAAEIVHGRLAMRDDVQSLVAPDCSAIDQPRSTRETPHFVGCWKHTSCTRPSPLVGRRSFPLPGNVMLRPAPDSVILIKSRSATKWFSLASPQFFALGSQFSSPGPFKNPRHPQKSHPCDAPTTSRPKDEH